MNTTTQAVVAAAQRLSPSEQLEIIQALSRSLQQAYPQTEPAKASDGPVLPAFIRRTPPVSDLRHLAADFWPDDESADSINNYLTRQRAAERSSDLAELTD